MLKEMGKIGLIIAGIVLAILALYPSPARAEKTKPASCPPSCRVTLTGNCYTPFPEYKPCAKDYCEPDPADDYLYVPARGECVAYNKKPVYTCLVDATGKCETAIGTIPVDSLQKFTEFLLQYVVAASGGIILLMLIATGYTVLTSGGNPEKLQGARENIVAIVSGLLLIVFSQVLLKAVGVDIFKLPGF